MRARRYGAGRPGRSAPERATPVFDAEALLDRLMGDRHMAGIVLKGFLRDAPSQLDDLRRRLADRDLPGARLRLHTLKGAAAAVAAEKLQCAARIDDGRSREHAGSWDRCRELLPLCGWRNSSGSGALWNGPAGCKYSRMTNR